MACPRSMPTIREPAMKNGKSAMKKTLVAMAALAVASAASAQSSVTLFGVVDVGFSGYENESKDIFGGTVKVKQTKLSSNGYTSSRLGFRGTEDLGGGLAASFWLEASLFPDNGTTGANVANSPPGFVGLLLRPSAVGP